VRAFTPDILPYRHSQRGEKLLMSKRTPSCDDELKDGWVELASFNIMYVVYFIFGSLVLFACGLFCWLLA